MNELISVIVPVYNVEEYLPFCIDSIIEQSYDNLEILLIDDGSTDNSGVICDKYSKIDKRVVSIHKTNGGLSSARNKGLDIAKGDYVSFVDSDDWLEKDFYRVLYDALISNNAEISACGRFLVSENDKTEMFSSNIEHLLTRKEALSCIFNQKLLDVAAWDKLYRKSIFDNVRFPIGEINEDTAVIYDIFSDVKKVIHVGKSLYNYRIRTGSITKSEYSKKFDVVLKNIKKLNEKIAKTDNDLSKDLSIYLCHLSYNMLIKIVRTDYRKYFEQYQEYYKIFKDTWFRYLISKNVTYDNKIRCILLRAHLFYPIFSLKRIVLK